MCYFFENTKMDITHSSGILIRGRPFLLPYVPQDRKLVVTSSTTVRSDLKKFWRAGYHLAKTFRDSTVLFTD